MEDAEAIVAGDGRWAELSLVVERDLLARFYRIFQGGFLIKARVGTGVGRFLRERLGLPPQYVAERISTIFLDGKPVDDLDAATVTEGSTLALSSAMPGLVGATMRRQGFYASLRNTITHKQEEWHGEEKEGLLRVKVFNLLMADLGPLFLERGIYVPSGELELFFAAEPDRFFDGIKGAALDGRSVQPSSLRRAGTIGGCGWTHLRACASP
jgi:hypothetical protein